MVNAACIVKASHLDLSSLSTHNRTAVVLPINVCCLRRRKRSEQRDDRRYGYAHRYQKCPHDALPDNNSVANMPLIGPSTMP